MYNGKRLVGLVVVRNAIELDYMPIEAAWSLSPLCDYVIISDMQSDDGTWEMMTRTLPSSINLILKRQPWDRPHQDEHWWTKALNYARTEFISPGDWLLQLDADEVVGPEARQGIAMAMANDTPGLFRRYNFWKSPQTLVPHNRCCGEMVARLGPADLYLPSDEPNPLVTPNIRTRAEHFSGLTIFHYGFLRKAEAFVKKSEVVQKAFFGSVDERISKAQANHTRWDDYDFFDGEALRPYDDKHPSIARQWLVDRGYQL
jgi:hypothetical protein